MAKGKKTIIAVVGMAGSGKTETAKYLVEKLNCPKVYFGSPTFERMKEEGLGLNYANEKYMREKIRAELGMGAYAILALPKIEAELEQHDTVIIESMYSWDEYKIIKEKFGEAFSVAAVHASPATRFSRLTNRKNERPIKDWEEFRTRDYTELENIAKGGPIAMADHMIVNEGGLKNLYGQIDNIIKNIIN